MRASELGLNPKEIVDNLITALTSDAMIAPSYWVDPENGNNYFVTVQYPENQVKSLDDLKAMPLRAARSETADLSEPGGGRGEIQDAHGSRPLPAATDDRCVCGSEGRRPGQRRRKRLQKIISATQAALERANQYARAGGDDAVFVPKLWIRTAAGDFAACTSSSSRNFLRSSIRF